MTIEARLKKLETLIKPEIKKHIIWVNYKDLDNGTPKDKEYDEAIRHYEETNKVKVATGDDINFVGWGRKRD